MSQTERQKNWPISTILDWHGIKVRVHFDFSARDEAAFLGIVETITDHGNTLDEIDSYLTEEAKREIEEQIVNEWRINFLAEDPGMYHKMRAKFHHEWMSDHGAYI